ncbi:MAG TPA: sulfotransferase domain-containing protein [Bacillales bacterium]|nr:sulfotransferase domain-containing protein [Bacillales bacterium]
MSVISSPVLAFFGHHKSGTAWISRIIHSLCSDVGIKHVGYHSPKVFNYNLQEKIEQEHINFFSYVNADINYAQPIQAVRGFHVVRDPRDIVVSAYFSHLNSHPVEFWSELAEQRLRLKESSKDEGLLLTMEFLKDLKTDGVALKLFDSMNSWDYSLPNILELKFEDMIRNPYKSFVKIFQFLGILEESEISLQLVSKYLPKNISEKILEKLFSEGYQPSKLNNQVSLKALLYFVHENSFSRLSGGREIGRENVTHHYRKGVAGDWKNHFKKQHKQCFKENYNDLLVKLGYEKDDNW